MVKMPSITRHVSSSTQGRSTNPLENKPSRSNNKLTRLVQNEKNTKASKSDDDTSENESIPSRKGRNSTSSPAKSTRATKRHHPSESEDGIEEIPKTRSRTNVEKINSADSKGSKRKSSSRESSKTAKKSKDDNESDSEAESEVHTRSMRSSNQKMDTPEKRNKLLELRQSKNAARSTRNTRSSGQGDKKTENTNEDGSASEDDVIVVKETAVAAECKSSRHSQEDSDEGDHQGSEESDDETVQAKPSIRRTRSQAKTASYEELTDSISEDSDDEVTEITDDHEIEEDDDDDEISFKGSPKPARKTGGAGGKPVLASALNELSSTLDKLKEQYEAKLKQKDEKIERLQNELKYKDEQLEDMQNLAHQNMEMEAKISLMMSSKQAYENEVERMLREKKDKDEQKDDVKKKKTEEGKKDGGGKTPTKRIAEPSDDSDIEIIEVDEVEKPSKVKTRKRQKSIEEISEDEEDGKKRKGKRGKQNKKQEDGNIDTLFVSDDSADEEEKVAKKKDNKTEDKTEDEEKTTKQTTEDEEEEGKSPGRHNIRKIMTNKKITQETKVAAQEEKDRRKRVAKSKHYKVEEKQPKNKGTVCTKLVLEYKEDKNRTPVVEVLGKLIKKLKPHQVEAVEFMWDCLIESVDRMKDGYEGSGCILAHCMGLGKTLSVIALLHTLMTNSKLCKKFRRCLVVCPLNTVLNWQSEWKKWLDKRDQLEVYELASSRNNHDRCEQIKEWHRDGEIMIVGYQLYRILVNLNTKSKKRKHVIDSSLVDPGPDIVVCDEGHMLKNDASAISKAMNRIRTKRRIVLTGTPLQNNLVEYHCMVSFVKPSLLGTRREFGNRFINPITNGQHADSTSRDVKIMKRRAHVLHEMLAGCVQRKDYSVITKLLPPKHEYVISVRLSKIQMELYEKYLQLNVTHDPNNPNRVISRGTTLFSDYQNLMRVWTHPWVLKLNEEREEKKFLRAIREIERRINRQEKQEQTAEISKGYSERDDDELESLLELSSESEVEETTTTASSESDDDDDKISTSRKTRRTLRSNKNESDKEESTKGKKGGSNISTQDSKTKDAKDEKGKNEGNTRKTNRRRDDKKKNKDENDTDDESGKRKAKVIAGEVIKNWQSHSRGNKDDEGDLNRKKENAWWSSMVSEEQKTMMELSGKLVLLFEILRLAQSVGDKVLVFSQSILSLDLIEDFLRYKTEAADKKKSPRKGAPSTPTYNKWIRDEDYYRMDGSTGAERRKQFTTDFNNIKNERMRLFLISTKAGGLGINLDTANRFIIFDASWNPSHDIQSIFRVYRFGQVKPVYVYRFLAQGTMEEKIYERQIIKEALSERVVDEHQLDRHFNATDLQELYRFKPERLDDPEVKNKPTPKVPDDVILAELLSCKKEWIVGYHEHDLLLEKRPEEDLTEEERKAAWEEYEREKKGFIYGFGGYDLQPMMMGGIPVTQAPVQMPKNPPLTTYLRPPEPKPHVQVPILPAVQRFPIPSSSTSNTLSFHANQLPRVVQEILKYNPTIKPEELQQRLYAFMGMQNKAQKAVVPGLAAPNSIVGIEVKELPDGKRSIVLKYNKPIVIANPQMGSTSSQPGGPIASMMGLVPGLPVAQPVMATTQVVRPFVLSALPSTSGAINNAAANMPSRLPQPGIVPAEKKS